MNTASRTSLVVAIHFINVVLSTNAVASTIYESGTLGATGLSAQDLLDQNMPGLNVFPNVFQGVSFEVQSPVLTSRVGGHFVGFEEDDSIFGAIVALTDEFDLPNSFDLSTSDVLGGTEIELSTISDEVFGDLELLLSPGWYAVVFGGELFGASGGGVALRNGLDIGNPNYIYALPNSIDSGWREQFPSLRNMRFVVEGTIIPEPTTLVLLTCGLFTILCRLRIDITSI